MVRPVRVESLKGLQQSVDVILGDDRPTVGDRENCLTGVGSRRNVDVTAGDVVTERVVEEVADKPSGQTWVAHCRCGGDGGLHVEPQLVDLGAGTEEHMRGDL